MSKARSHILNKVKRVNGRRVIIRIKADIKVQCVEGSGLGSALETLFSAGSQSQVPALTNPTPTLLSDDEKTI